MFSTSLLAEKAFYNAFQQCDIDAMALVWCDGEPYCIHPGAGLLSGKKAVMQSWTQILQGAMLPTLNTELMHRHVTEGCCIHVVQESFAANEKPVYVLATNIYVLSQDGWRIHAHHAGQPIRSDQHTTAAIPQGATIQ